MHYYRLRRTGSVADPERLQGVCAAEDCEREDITRTGYCQLHTQRLRKRGDASFEFKGENVPHWTGEDATNRAVHQRLRAQRGKASTHRCIDCGRPAAHWSYDHADPNEKTEEGVGPYSTDIAHYQPRCVKCHKRFDMAIVMAKPTWRMSQKKVRQITRQRARDLCERCGRRRAHSLHHLKNRSQGGEWSPQNCVWLCGDGVRGCHGWVTEHPDAAWEEGFHLRSWETPGERPIRSGVHGVVFLADDGSVHPIGGAA
ncbi:HNH endonuclease [Nocardia nova]|uniref:HNH endonuclease n=1 Tax=Nocardia nova TaxID=37330 RepID=UPI0037B97252